MNNWTDIPAPEVISKLAETLNTNNIEAFVVENKAEAFEKLKSLIPENAEVNTGSSTTLKEIGFIEHLKHESSTYNYIGEAIRKENDDSKRKELRRRSIAVEYFVSSVNALTEDGKLVAVDATGSRVGSIPFAAEKVVIVVSANKILKNLNAAFERINSYVVPLEDKRMKQEYGEQAGTSTNKWIIIEKEFFADRIKVIIVKEKLGF